MPVFSNLGTGIPILNETSSRTNSGRHHSDDHGTRRTRYVQTGEFAFCDTGIDDRLLSRAEDCVSDPRIREDASPVVDYLEIDPLGPLAKY